MREKQKIPELFENYKLKMEDGISVRISVVKTLHAEWIVKFYNYVRSKPDLDVDGWKESGIMERINDKINLDPFSSRNCFVFCILFVYLKYLTLLY